jgi:Anti-sigma-K factor rskA
MSTSFWTGRDVDDLVDRLTIHLDEDAARSGPPAQPDEAAQPGEPDREGAGALSEELRTAATWAGPPASLRDSILARARSAAPAATAGPAPAVAAVPAVPPVPAAPVAPQPAPEPLATPASRPPASRPAAPWLAGWRTRWRRLAWAVPATALAAALFTVGVLAVDRALQPDPPPAEVFAVAGTQLAPQARGEVRLSDTPTGFSIVVDVQGLPAAAPGSYYAAWLRGPEGIVPLGSFHNRGTGTPVRLWSGVPPDRYPDLVVTLQAEGDQLAPSQLVVMTVSLTR